MFWSENLKMTCALCWFSMVLVFVWSPSVIKPVSVLVVLVPVLVALISLIVSGCLLVSPISGVVPVESLSVLRVFVAGITVISVI